VNNSAIFFNIGNKHVESIHLHISSKTGTNVNQGLNDDEDTRPIRVNYNSIITFILKLMDL